MRFFKRHKLMTIILVALSVFIYLNYTIVLQYDTIPKNSKYYINELYLSNQRVYEKKLSGYEQNVYDNLMESIKKRVSLIEVNRADFSDLSTEEISSLYITANEAIMLDHPELLQFGYIMTEYSDTNIIVRIYYAIDNPILEEINTLKIRKIITNIKIATKDMTDLEKIRYVYEWIGDNTHYDMTFTTMAKNQSIYNAFIKKNAVCAGFAKTSQVIFQNIGIDSMTIIGNSTGLHMWNIIKYNDKYYYYDSTVAAGIRNKNNKHYYDGLKQTEMNDYTMSHAEWYPTIETTNALFPEAN